MTDLVTAAPSFIEKLRALRATVTGVNWYPYDSLGNVYLLKELLAHDATIVRDRGSVLDVGCADGDMGFLFHSLGCDVDFLDNAATNFNDCRGVKRSAQLLRHRGRVIERDIDFGFELDRDYDFVLFLGTLYHLRNPALALIRLAERCQTMVVSTRVMRCLPEPAVAPLGDASVAYLVDTLELNADPTNWWIFSPAALTRLLKRCGWTTIAARTFGAVDEGDPVAAQRDERMFVFCERVANYAELTAHHHF